MEDENEEREADPMIEDRMIGEEDDEEDSEMLRAIQESLYNLTQQRKYESQIERLQKEAENRRVERLQRETELLETRKKKLGIVLARLRSMLTHSSNPNENEIIQDIIHDIEWSLTHSSFLYGFTHFSCESHREKQRWIETHLSNSFQDLLRQEHLFDGIHE